MTQDEGIENLNKDEQVFAKNFVEVWEKSIRPLIAKERVGYMMVVVYPDGESTDGEADGGNALGLFTNIDAKDQVRILDDASSLLNTYPMSVRQTTRNLVG